MTTETLMKIMALADKVVTLSIKIHRDLGPGLLESAYSHILTSLLRRDGHLVRTEVPINFIYDGIQVENDYRLDLFIDNILVVELKAVEKMLAVHYRQVLTYVKILNLPVGLLINFGGETITHNFSRIINTTHPLSQQHLTTVQGFRG